MGTKNEAYVSTAVGYAFCSILPCERAYRAAEAARGAKRLVLDACTC